MERRTIFWDVDTQYDFLMPDGKLYIKGADQIIDTISSMRAAALDNGCSIIASQNWHSLDDPEISNEPDWKHTFPPHCMVGTPGAQRIGYLGNLPIEHIGPELRNPGELEELVQRRQFHIVIRKGALSVFSNPNTAPLIELVAPGRIVIFGVALDFCVADTLRGLARFPDTRLILVRDATKGLGATPDEQVFDEMQDLGVEVTESARLQEMVPCG